MRRRDLHQERILRTVCACFVVGLVGATPLAVTSDASPFGRGCVHGWKAARTAPVVDAPGGRSDGKVVAISPKSAWFIGTYTGGNADLGDVPRAIAERWNGRRWKHVPKRVRHVQGEWFNDVAADSNAQVWIVGGFVRGSKYEFLTPYRPLVERWAHGRLRPMGTAWGGPDSDLLAVSVISPRAVWAVGKRDYLEGERPLVEHWDGHVWAVSHLPQTSTSSNLLDVAARRNDIWAVGATNYGTRLEHKPVAAHWNGKSWRFVSIPRTQGADEFLLAVASASRSEVWAVGERGCCGSQTRPFSMRWRGQRWKRVRMPRLGSAARLEDIAVAGPNNVWAVGAWLSPKGQPVRRLIEHWDGRRWEVARIPSPRSRFPPALVAVSFVGRYGLALASLDGWYGILRYGCLRRR